MAIFDRPLYCPACLTEIDRHSVEWRQPSDDGGYESLGQRPLDEPRRRRRPDDIWAHAGQYPTCPDGHAFPPDFGDRKRCHMALVGPLLSMKSHWIARTTRDLRDAKNSLPTSVANVAWAANEHSEGILRDEYDSYLDRNRVLPRTRPVEAGRSRARQPITMEADFEFLTGRGVAQERRYLMLFDVPGEAITAPLHIAKQYGAHILDADLVVFFIDVLRLPGLREELEPLLTARQRTDYEGALEPEVVLRYAKLMRQRHGIRSGPVPRDAIAIVTKADLLAHTSSPIASGPDLAGLSTTKRSEIAERLVRDHASGLDLQMRRGFRSVTYHLASAVGAQPNVDGTLPDAKGWGCTEALTAGLHRVGFFAP